ncbi:WD repeat-containing protein WRAP73 [Diplogelasinospora grovesii]|uniref:WD repeat-containing protein WRAP73 n=1 Tax=Diplogelasinospora grovesii TaxID=303347 RepID=A0AAN6S494_9PEZI|nr:WD repeat-containing protein WRAP73 [Diplogelasinospora grovesii]
MRFSPSLKSSAQCLPSPDGRFIATLFPSIISVRAVQSLDVVNVIKLPSDCPGQAVGLQWSPSSRLLLVAIGDQLRAFSVLDDSFHATVRSLVGSGTKPPYLGFGASDTEICVVSSFGLKFAIYDLASSKAVEISNPKFFSPATARKGFSFRPRTRHLALLTRTAGKDMISVHAFPTREVQRSWAPDTIDAQGLVWSPDGRWLVVWESAALGHKVIFYTPDGQSFKTWTGPPNPAPGSRDYALGAGVKLVQFSADSRHLAVGDNSRCVCIFGMASVTETMWLQHPNNLVPKDTIQIWQEQIGISQTGPSIHTFLKAFQTVCPPTRPQDNRPQDQNSELKAGCAAIVFDPSSALVATRLEDSPSTVWVWDTQVSELRAVLLFHGDVSSLSWHPTVRETLLIICEGDQYNGLAFVWDPLSEGPRSIDFSPHFPGAKTTGKSRVLWLDLDASSPPSVFYTDAQHYVLASLASLGDLDQDLPPWVDQGSAGRSGAGIREESPLELVPAAEARDEGFGEEEDDDSSELEDTFIYKR